MGFYGFFFTHVGIKKKLGLYSPEMYSEMQHIQQNSQIAIENINSMWIWNKSDTKQF